MEAHKVIVNFDFSSHNYDLPKHYFFFLSWWKWASIEICNILNRNSIWKFRVRAKNFPMQVSRWVKVFFTVSLRWSTESCLFWKRLLSHPHTTFPIAWIPRSNYSRFHQQKFGKCERTLSLLFYEHAGYKMDFLWEMHFMSLI